MTIRCGGPIKRPLPLVIEELLRIPVQYDIPCEGYMLTCGSNGVNIRPDITDSENLDKGFELLSVLLGHFPGRVRLAVYTLPYDTNPHLRSEATRQQELSVAVRQHEFLAIESLHAWMSSDERAHSDFVSWRITVVYR